MIKKMLFKPLIYRASQILGRQERTKNCLLEVEPGPSQRQTDSISWGWGRRTGRRWGKGIAVGLPGMTEEESA